MNKICNDLMNALGIRVDLGETVRQVDDQVDITSGGKWLQSFYWRQYSLTYRHRLEAERNLTRFNTGKLQEFPHHLCQGIHLRFNPVQKTWRGRRVVQGAVA